MLLELGMRKLTAFLPHSVLLAQSVLLDAPLTSFSNSGLGTGVVVTLGESSRVLAARGGS